MAKRPVRLYRQEQFTIDPMALLFMCVIFAIVFFILGMVFRHYPSINGVI